VQHGDAQSAEVGHHGEASANVQSLVEEDTKKDIDHALLLHQGMVVNHASAILNTSSTAITTHAKLMVNGEHGLHMVNVLLTATVASRRDIDIATVLHQLMVVVAAKDQMNNPLNVTLKDAQFMVNGVHGVDMEIVVNPVVEDSQRRREPATVQHHNSVDVHVKDQHLTSEDVTSKAVKWTVIGRHIHLTGNVLQVVVEVSKKDLDIVITQVLRLVEKRAMVSPRLFVSVTSLYHAEVGQHGVDGVLVPYHVMVVYVSDSETATLIRALDHNHKFKHAR